MLKRSKRLDRVGLENYLKNIVREHVEKPGKVRVKSTDGPHTIKYKVSVASGDRANLTAVQMTTRSLRHIMKRATLANVGKDGTIESHIGTTK
jgi:predicted RNA-binding protein YlqC (UPF0109 family)